MKCHNEFKEAWQWEGQAMLLWLWLLSTSMLIELCPLWLAVDGLLEIQVS